MILALENVSSVYSGKANHCCCGCSGKHTYAYASALRDAAAKSRGYAVQNDEVNDRAVKTIFNKVAKSANLVKISDTCYSVDTATRTYVVYLKGH